MRSTRASAAATGSRCWAGSPTTAELRFENVPAGPFVGIDAIRAAYREQPPDDEIQLLGVQERDEHTAVAAFAWLKGGTGRLVLAHERGAITALTVIFDE